jgi:arylsulfatase A-like enzyme
MRAVYMLILAALASLPLAGCGRSRPERPNVLLVIVSGARPDHMSAYGYPRATTPALQKLAAGGTLYENAITTAPWSLTAQASLVTGLYPSEHQVDFAHPVLEAALQTLAEKMKSAGYDTFGVSTDDLIGQGTGFTQGFDLFKELHPAAQGLPDEGGAAAESELLSWMGGRQKDTPRPFFAQVVLSNPHLPFNPQGEYQQKFIEHPIPQPRLEQLTQFWIPFARQFTLGMVQLTPDEKDALVSLYDGEIAYADYRLGRMVDALEKDRVLDDTLVVVAGDAGDDLGDHGQLSDVSYVWDSVVRVPLMLRLPERVPAGKKEAGQVQTIDLMEAIDRLTAPWKGSTGVSEPVVRPRPAAIIEARYEPGAIAYYQRVMPAGDVAVFQRNLLAVRTPELKYILSSQGGEGLFDLVADPRETRSVAAERLPEAREMSARLNAWAAALRPPPGAAARGGTPAP